MARNYYLSIIDDETGKLYVRVLPMSARAEEHAEQFAESKGISLSNMTWAVSAEMPDIKLK